MYEQENEWREFAGDSREEAVGKAIAFFKVSGADDLKIADLADDVFGLGGRNAVLALPANATPPNRSDSGRREGREARDDRSGGRRDRPPRRDDDSRPRRDRDRNRDRDRDRDHDRGRSREGRVETNSEPIQLREVGAGTAKNDLSEVGEFVKGLLERMRLGDFEISESAEDEKLIALEVSGAIADGLVHGGERTMEAVQLLANQAAMRIGEGDGPRIVVDVEGERSKRLVVDVEGERSKREDLLERVGDRAGRRAKTTGRPVALEPLNSKDRRTIHMALRETDGIATMSVGEGRYRQVVVVPESAPEYEEAKGYESSPRSD
jgi:spoIIIJ-associated protein